MAEDAKVQGRMYPELRIRKTGTISRIQGTFLIVVGLGAMALFVNMAVGDPLGGGCPFALALFLGLPLIYLGLWNAGLSLGEWLFALLQRRVWRGPRVTVQGQIVDRRAGKYWHEGRFHTVLLITFQFQSALGPVVLRTEVDEARYKQLKGVEQVMVRYAVENPRLALLEWEWEDEEKDTA